MADNKTHKVWTRQDESVFEILEESGVYRVREKYIRAKMGNYADVYLKVYKWLRSEAAKRMEISGEARYPIWLATEEELRLPVAEGAVSFELEIPDDKIMIFDMEKWDYIVNHMYLPEDDQDRERFKEKLEKYNISVESDIYTENFYPLLKQEMVASWKRLFDDSIRLSEHDLAIAWELRKEWVVTYEKYN